MGSQPRVPPSRSSWLAAINQQWNVCLEGSAPVIGSTLWRKPRSAGAAMLKHSAWLDTTHKGVTEGLTVGNSHAEARYVGTIVVNNPPPTLPPTLIWFIVVGLFITLLLLPIPQQLFRSLSQCYFCIAFGRNNVMMIIITRNSRLTACFNFIFVKCFDIISMWRRVYGLSSLKPAFLWTHPTVPKQILKPDLYIYVTNYL